MPRHATSARISARALMVLLCGSALVLGGCSGRDASTQPRERAEPNAGTPATSAPGAAFTFEEGGFRYSIALTRIATAIELSLPQGPVGAPPGTTFVYADGIVTSLQADRTSPWPSKSLGRPEPGAFGGQRYGVLRLAIAEHIAAKAKSGLCGEVVAGFCPDEDTECEPFPHTLALTIASLRPRQAVPVRCYLSQEVPEEVTAADVRAFGYPAEGRAGRPVPIEVR